jgi:hypothetical protein
MSPDDRKSKPLRPLVAGESIRFRKPHSNHYSPANITKIVKQPRSYVVTDETGRRNRQQLRISKEPKVEINTEPLYDPLPESVIPELNPDNTSIGPRRSTRVRLVPQWHQEYDMT